MKYRAHTLFYFLGSTVIFLVFVNQISKFESSDNSSVSERQSNLDSYLINLQKENIIRSSNHKFNQFHTRKKSKDESLKSLLNADQYDPDLIEHIRGEVKPPSGLPYNLTNPDIEDHSQFKQGQYLYEYFRDKKFGTFIEVGAFDGETLSNTLILEKKLNWRGLLIEPNPFNYKSIPAKNRKAHHINCCLSITSSASKLNMSNNHYLSEIIAPNVEQINVGNNEKPKGYFTANCYPLYSIMAAAGLTTLDLLSLDLEGVEFKVLETIPWDKLDIKSMIIEVNHIPEGRISLWKLLNKNNYRLQKALTIDNFYVKI